MGIIGAEAARWAGLQIDLNSKYRAGQLTADQLERFNNLSPEAREERFGFWKRPIESSKFELLKDLGIITVPSDYVHGTQLESFMKKNRKKFYSVNENITDANFPNPSRILKPGDRLWVRSHKQVVSGTTTSEERMAFLATLNSHHTGAQGVSLVFEQKRDQLPKGYWCGSFDEKDHFWEDAERCHRVPGVRVYSDGDFHFRLGLFEEPWRGSDVILSFCDVPLITKEEVLKMYFPQG